MSADQIANARRLVDPKNEYRWNQLSRCERLALRVLEECREARLSGRTRDVLQMELPSGAAENDEITIVITPDHLEVRFPAVEWPHPHEPVSSSRLWKRSRLDLIINVTELIVRARKARLAEFVSCRFCGRSVASEAAHDSNVCGSCAEQHLHIVH